MNFDEFKRLISGLNDLGPLTKWKESLEKMNDPSEQWFFGEEAERFELSPAERQAALDLVNARIEDIEK